MRTLQEAISKMDNKGGAGASLRKHLAASGINEWEDISRQSLYDFRDEVCEAVAPSTARTVMAYAKALLNRYQDGLNLPADWAKILSVKGAAPMKTYLNEEELEAFAKAEPRTLRQKWVQSVFLVCAYTGLRVSDAVRLTTENIVGGSLHFVAQKTKKPGAIPLKGGLERRIAWIAAHSGLSVTPAAYNNAVRQIARDAGIDAEVVVQKAGKELKGPKWMFLSSHSARISTATCLARRGVPIADISGLLQHTSQTTTMRYIVLDHIALSKEALAFFK